MNESEIQAIAKALAFQLDVQNLLQPMFVNLPSGLRLEARDIRWTQRYTDNGTPIMRVKLRGSNYLFDDPLVLEGDDVEALEQALAPMDIKKEVK